MSKENTEGQKLAEELLYTRPHAGEADAALNRAADVSSTQGGEHGLGLKLVRQIVKAHGGTVRFRQAAPCCGLKVSIVFSISRVQ